MLKNLLKKTSIQLLSFLILGLFLQVPISVFACDSTPVITYTSNTDNGDGTFDLGIQVCVGDGGSVNGFTTDVAGLNIVGFTPATITAATSGNTVTGSLSGGILDYNFAAGVPLTNPLVAFNIRDCFAYTITVDGNPSGVNITYVGVNSESSESAGSCSFLGGDTQSEIAPSAPISYDCNSGTVLDPGGAGNYGNSANETYTICPANPAIPVQIDFTVFDLESGFDFLTIYDNSSATGASTSFTGTTSPGTVLATNPTGCLTLIFTSDGSVTDVGFSFNITCGTSTFGCSDGNFTDGPGNYSNSANETYNYCSDIPGTPIIVDFTSFNTESGLDILTVYDNSTATGPSTAYSGTTSPGTITSTNPSNCLTFVFTSDGSGNSTGWDATVACYNDCSSADFTDGPSNYSNSANETFYYCSEIPGTPLSLDFSVFNLENGFDFLTIYDNSSASGASTAYTGTTSPGVVTSTNPTGCLTIVFTSDGSVNSTGWVADVVCCVPNTGTFDTTVCNGTTFVFNGTTYGGGTLSGTETLTNVNGCDSVVTVTITDLTPLTGTFDTTICNGTTFNYNGTTYGGGTLSGSETLTSTYGCDSVVTVTITELAPITGTFDTTICNGTTFNYNGTTYGGGTLSGSETLTSTYGCDSVITVTITELAPITGTFDTTICNGTTFNYNGTTYGGGTLSGTEILTSTYGCDSVITVTITELAPITGTFDTTICNGTTFNYNGTTYGGATLSGTEILTASNNCDSVITVTVTELAPITGTLDTTVCNGTTFNYNGTTYGGATLSGTETFTSTYGCDSIITVTVTELVPITGTLDTTICNGTTFNYNGTTYGGANLSGTETFTSTYGCDSIITVTVTELAPITGIFDTTICNGTTFNYNGTTYGGANLSGTETFTSTYGCDSIITVTVSELAPITGIFDTTICNGTTFNYNGTTYGGATLSGTETLTSTYGCDSVITVTITELAPLTGTFDTTICNATTFVYNGTTYGGATLSGTETLTSTYGCDSVITVTITELAPITGTFDTTICNGSSFVYNGTTYDNGNLTGTETLTSSYGCDSVITVTVIERSLDSTFATTTSCIPADVGTVTSPFMNQFGCDSTHTITTTLDPFSSATENITACDSVEVLTIWYFASTNFNDTILGGAANGCDSITTFNLTINSSQTGTFDTTICNGASFVYNGTTYDNSNLTGTETLSTSNGCDSVITVTVTELTLITGTFDTTICNGSTFVYNGTTYGGATLSGTETLTSTYGCDSIITVTITELAPITGTFDTTICNGSTFVYNGTTYGNGTLSGTEALTSTYGCDSVITVTITELAPITGTFDTTVCNGTTFIYNGNTYGNGTLSGMETLTSTYGCDSVVTVTITELAPITGTFDTTICNGTTFAYNGTTYGGATLSGTEILTSTYGCDSVITVTITELAPITGTLDTTVCNGITFVYNGTTYGGATLSGTETFTSTYGCDSVITVTVTELAPITGTFDTTICNGTTFAYNGTTYGGATLSGTETLTSSYGCDSVVTVTINELAPITGTFDTTICNGATFVYNGTTYGSGTLNGSEVLTSTYGCDSVVTVTITELAPITGTFDTTICNGSTFVYNGTTYGGATLSGTETLTSTYGCDSIITVTITELAPITGTFDTTICNGSTFVYNGTTYGNGILSGMEALTSTYGCDSVITVTITELAPITGTFDTTVCNGTTFVYNETTYGGATLSGLETLTSSYGCDSIITVTITELALITGTFDTTVCNGTTFIYNGTTYGGANLSGFETFTAFNNCDSIVTVTITELAPITGAFDTTVCNGSTFTYQGTTYGGVNLNGTETFTSSYGCDSVVTVTITELAPITGVFDTIICDGTTFVYNGTTYGGVNLNGTETLTSVYGCDSIVTVTIINQVPTVEILNPIICNGESFSIHGFTYNVSGNYSEIIPYTNTGCDSIQLTVNLTVNPTYLINQTITICSDESYVLPDGVTVNTQGNYTSNLLTINNCDSIYITELIVNQIGSFTPIDDVVVCSGFTNTFDVTTSNMVSFEWFVDNGAGFISLIDSTNYFGANTSSLTANLYVNLHLNNYLLEMIDECGNIYTETVQLEVYEPHNVANPLPDTNFCLHELDVITVDYNGSEYVWSNGDFGSTILPEESGEYIVNFIENGTTCEMSDTINITIEDCIANCVVLGPTGFSPNGDSSNDLFRVVSSCDEGFSYYLFNVYNRWGELMFSTTDYRDGWDGTFRNRNSEIGVYTYFVEYIKEFSDEKEMLKGNVTLIR